MAPIAVEEEMVFGVDADATDKQNMMRNEEEVNRAIERHADTIRRLCMIHLKNHADTEDIFQTVFLFLLKMRNMKEHGLFGLQSMPAKTCSKTFFTAIPYR